MPRYYLPRLSLSRLVVGACILGAVLRYSANISLLFREVPLLERFAAARAAGFAAVEIQIPYEHPAEVLARAAHAAGVRVVLINAPMGPVVGAPGMACRPELRHLSRVELERACEYASALSCLCVNVLAGRAAVQPADPPKPGAMKVMSRAGNVGADRKLMKSWAAKLVPTGSVEKFRFSIPACVLPRLTKLPLTLFPIVA